MPFIKLGEMIEINPASIQSEDAVIPMIDDEILSAMKEYVETIKNASHNGKRIAPKANDFLYFSAVMMHAAEAVLVNEDGTSKLTRSGEPLKAHWDKTGGSWRWQCNDKQVKAFKNSNGDIFPEEELVKAYRKWIGRPLCIDHKSSSVDHVRGFIVDTYYDRSLKRVIALCALDKKNYPELARKIETGYSNSVSMGTAVERAICYDCGTVARTEQDFCQHMRSKSCYGEINIGLNPMELSIVVNGADPAAKIKHIIAMANTLNSYVEEKSSQLKKLAQENYNANLTFNLNEDGNSTQFNVNSKDLEEFKASINEAIDNFQKIKTSENEEFSTNQENSVNDTAFNQSSGAVAMDETVLPTTDYSNAPPHATFASTEELEKELFSIKVSIEEKLAQMQKDLNKLSSLNNKKEEIMSGKKENMNKQGYYQGAGGENEPTPGQKKYPVDPTQDKLRDDEDRQMVGQKPFPDTGPVDGLHPGHESSPTNELERKKMLARAEAENRSIRRTAVLNKAKDAIEESAKKEAYFQNGENDSNPNTPTPGKTKYKADPLQDQLRDKEDKHMVGQKPFPDVGSVDGAHPSPDSADQRDEIKRKELMSRAGLKARFIKASNEDGQLDKGNSSWEVLRGDDTILTKTVDELTNGEGDTFYGSVATAEFGKDLLSKVKTFGAKAVSALYKSAQAAPPPPALPPTDLAPPMEDSKDDLGKEGDPKETALELSEKIRDLSSDLVEAVRGLTGEQAEMGELPSAADDSKVSSASDAVKLHAMRKELNGALVVAINEAVAGLNDHERELSTIVGLYDKNVVNDVNRDFVASIVDDAITEAKQALAESFKLLGAFVKYARGSHAIEKRAHDGDAMPGNELENKEIMDMLGETGAELGELSLELDGPSADDVDLVSELLADDLSAVEASDDNDAVITSDPAQAAELAKKDPSVPVELKTATLEDRSALRAKLAGEVKWNPILNDFHKHLVDPDFDIKPSNDGGHVETIDEIHDVMMDVATSGPKVRKEAEEIQKLISTGALNVKDLDLLVANGVDPAAVKYWKELYGDAGPEGKQFANELTKVHASAQADEEKAVYRVKLARSYELAYEMVDRGLCPRDRTSISSQVDEIMTWNDQGFESMKKVLARHEPVQKKTASYLPQVGVFGSEEQSSDTRTDYDLLVEAFSTTKSKRMF